MKYIHEDMGSHLPAKEVKVAQRMALDWLIASSGLLTGLSMMGLAPVLPVIEGVFADTSGAAYLAKLVIAIVGLSVMVAAPFSVLATRRYSCRTILLVSFVGYGLSAVASAMAPTLMSLVVARFVQGVCVAIGVTTVLGLLGQYERSEREVRLGLHMGGSAVGIFLLLPFSGFLGDISWRLSPLLGLVVMVHIGLVLLAGQLLNVRLSTPVASAPRVAVPGELVECAKIVALSVVIGIVLYSPPAFIPFKAISIGIVTSSGIALVTTVTTASAAVVSLAYAKLVKGRNTRLVYLCGFLLVGTGMLGTAFSQGSVLLVLASLVAGMGGGLLVPHIYADCAERFSGDTQVRMTGLIKSGTFAGLFGGSLILQSVVEIRTINAAFLILAALMMLLFVMMLISRYSARARV